MSEYVFARTSFEPEFARLQAIERVFDPATERILRATGLTRGWRCLEAGAGAGSIARWLSQQAGADRVVALDRDTRYLQGDDFAGISVVEADLQSWPQERATFDLVHERYVLIHCPDAQGALDALLAHVKPGGWLVLEEPDFSVARALAGDPDGRHAFERVSRAIATMYTAAGIDHAFGATLSRRVAAAGLVDPVIESDAPTVSGGSGLATVMALSAVQLREKYLKTALVTEDDLAGYARFCADPDSRAIHYATVRAAGRKRRSASTSG